jgi:hypothetical protein
MPVAFTDLTDAEIRRYCVLLENKASALMNGLRQIEADRARAAKPLVLLTQEQADLMVQSIEAELRASMAIIAAQEITPEAARLAEAAEQQPQEE